MPSAASAFSASGVDALTGSAIANRPASLPSTAMIDRRWRRRRAAARPRHRALPCRCRSTPGYFALPSATVLPSTLPIAPLPVGESKSSTLRKRELALLRGAHDGVRQRMLAGALDAGGKAQDVALVKSGRRHDGDHLRLALGQRAGLVDHQRVDLLHALQRLGVLDQHAGLRAAADADHDRHRRRQSERAGTGDDQHADGGDEAEGQPRLRPEPAPRRRTPRSQPRSRPARTSPRPDRPAAGSARASAARPRPSARSATAACRARPCRRA